jgi:hypothetical protein
MFIICWKRPRKYLEIPPQISEPPQMTTHQLTLRVDSFIYQSIAFEYKYVIHISIDT